MSLREKTGVRDLTFSRWHREAVSDDCSWIDLDCVHFCKYCGSLLAIFELVSSSPNNLVETVTRKNAGVCEKIGVMTGMPAYKIAHTREEITRAAVMDMATKRVVEMTAVELAAFIEEVHDCRFCEKHRQGRFAHK